MPLKDTDDLKDSAASIGGAMGTWPHRTLWYLCRWERTGVTDPDAADALRETNNKTLRELEEHAEDFGLSTDTLAARRRTLEAASVEDLRTALERAYAEEFPSGQSCPFEREGSDMACHRCPVAADALNRLREWAEADVTDRMPEVDQ